MPTAPAPAPAPSSTTGQQQLVLDPASLGALHDLTDALKRASRTQQQQTAFGTPGHGPPNAPSPGTPTAPFGPGGYAAPTGFRPPGWTPATSNMSPGGPGGGFGGGGFGGGAANHHLEAIHKLQLGQAQGLKLQAHPMTGEMEWIKGGGTGAGAAAKAGASGMGGMGGMAGMLGKAAGPMAALAAVAHVTESVTKVSDLVQDRHLTGAQKEREGFKSLVPFGSTIMAGVDSLSGRTSDMSRLHENARYNSVDLRGQTAQRSFDMGYMPQQAGLQSYAKAIGGQAPALSPIMDRSGASGEQGYKDAMRILPLKQETLKTERELARATAERGTAEMNQIQTARRINALKEEQFKLRPQLDDNNASGPKLLEKQQRFAAISSEIQQLAPINQQGLQNVADAKRREAGAKGEHQKAQMREDVVARADFFQDRATTAKGTATALGQMNPLERAQAAQAVLLAKKHGVDAIPQEFKAAAASIAPQEMQKLFEQAGAGSQAYKSLQQGGVVDAPNVKGFEKPADLQKRADELYNEAGSKEHQIDQGVAKEAADAGKDLGAFIGNVIKTLSQATKDEIFATLRIGKNQ